MADGRGIRPSARGAGVAALSITRRTESGNSCQFFGMGVKRRFSIPD